MAVAKATIGTKEFAGKANNPVILSWAQKVTKFIGWKYTKDEIPWCGVYAAYIMNEAGFAPPQGTAMAATWAKWGVPLKKAAYGSVLVFKRPGGNHVGFYVSEDATTYHVLGGNQSDSVNITRIGKDRCIAIRWPKDVPLPTAGPVLANLNVAVSKNEA